MSDFFPRHRGFWLYHCSALAAWIAVQGMAIYFRDAHRLFDVVGTLVWLPLFTLGVLTFRFHYRQRNWKRLSTGRLVPAAVGYAFVIAAAVVTVLMLATVPFYREQLFDPAYLQQTDHTAGGLIAVMLISNIALTAVIACAWIFMYIAITTGRRVRRVELNNLKLENSLKEARLSSLSNQLNPHFLFNSLNNIRFMIHENPDRADKTITALSEILRYSLQSGREDQVTLGEELTIVRRYVDVAGLQLEGRLDFQLAVPESLTGCLVPPMCLQLLVENAVKHGIEHIKGPALLTVEASAGTDTLVLTVANPLPPDTGPNAEGTQTGLKNIEQRLHLLYGGAARLETRRAGNRFTVSLTLPRETRA